MTGTRPIFNNRALTLGISVLGAALVFGTVLAGWALGSYGLHADFSIRLLPPSAEHWFGTDQMGHDMLARTVHGLGLSLRVGLLASAISVIIATSLALIAATGGRWADGLVGFLVDAAMGLPHLVLLILIAFALGGGTTAVIIAVALTHWPRLTRVLRAEILGLRTAPYVLAARRFGKSRLQIGLSHMLPHLGAQMLVGLVLMFPHAILHEAGLTFLGFGLDPGRPAIGILLSEATRHLLAGKYWLALYPGLCLVALVLAFDALGNGLRLILDPRGSQR